MPLSRSALNLAFPVETVWSDLMWASGADANVVSENSCSKCRSSMSFLSVAVVNKSGVIVAQGLSGGVTV